MDCAVVRKLSVNTLPGRTDNLSSRPQISHFNRTFELFHHSCRAFPPVTGSLYLTLCKKKKWMNEWHHKYRSVLYISRIFSHERCLQGMYRDPFFTLLYPFSECVFTVVSGSIAPGLWVSNTVRMDCKKRAVRNQLYRKWTAQSSGVWVLTHCPDGLKIIPPRGHRFF